MKKSRTRLQIHHLQAENLVTVPPRFGEPGLGQTHKFSVAPSTVHHLKAQDLVTGPPLFGPSHAPGAAVVEPAITPTVGMTRPRRIGRAQKRALLAIDANYGGIVPEDVQNVELYQRVSTWLKDNGKNTVSLDTILRAVGRRE